MANVIQDRLDNGNIALREATDSRLMVNGKEYFPLNVRHALLATSPSQAREYYSKKTQFHHPWLILDLETGGRGAYPGCRRFAETTEDTVVMRADVSDLSRVTHVISGKGTSVRILERYAQKDDDWLLCSIADDSGDHVGYIRCRKEETGAEINLGNMRYE